MTESSSIESQIASAKSQYALNKGIANTTRIGSSNEDLSIGNQESKFAEKKAAELEYEIHMLEGSLREAESAAKKEDGCCK